jgi:6-pyruvoyltetrahydropterin/6-carboxytetrahydropterin synthase
MHGHSYELIVTVDRPVEEASGMAIDFSDLKRVVRVETVDRLDHRCVNDLMENPTAERMAEWVWERLAPHLPGLVEVELGETRDCSVVYRGP